MGSEALHFALAFFIYLLEDECRNKEKMAPC